MCHSSGVHRVSPLCFVSTMVADAQRVNISATRDNSRFKRSAGVDWL